MYKTIAIDLFFPEVLESTFKHIITASYEKSQHVFIA